MSSDKTAAASKVTVLKAKQLTERQKTTACVLWASGEVTLEDLAKKFGKTTRTFERLFKARGISKGERKSDIEARAKAEAEKVGTEEAAELAKRIKETKDDHYKMAKGLVALLWNEIVSARTEKIAVGAKHANIKALKDAMAALQLGRQERYAVLGLLEDKSGGADEMVDLVIQELRDEQVRELHQRRQAVESEIPDLDLGIGIPDLPAADSPT